MIIFVVKHYSFYLVTVLMQQSRTENQLVLQRKETFQGLCGLLRWISGKVSSCQWRRCSFDLWVGKIPWRRKWQATPGFLPGKFHGQRNLAGQSPWGCKEQDTYIWKPRGCVKSDLCFGNTEIYICKDYQCGQVQALSQLQSQISFLSVQYIYFFLDSTMMPQ